MKSDRELDALLDQAFDNNPSVSEGLEQRILQAAAKTPQKHIFLFAFKPMLLRASFCCFMALSGFWLGVSENGALQQSMSNEVSQTNYELSELLWGSEAFERDEI